MTEPERCGVIAYTLPPAPDRPTGVTARCRLALGHEGFHRPAEEPTEPDRIRWIRYVADCAEHVLPLSGKARPQAEAAIRAVREWCDDPTEERRIGARRAGEVAYAAATDAYFASDSGHLIYATATDAAADAAGYAAYETSSAAAGASHAVTHASDAAAYSAGITYAAARAAEREWQAERRRFYGLEEVEP
jgi:hypothetical protein